MQTPDPSYQAFALTATHRISLMLELPDVLEGVLASRAYA